ncbi:hypothetical protein ACG7TL_002529 [Trametes sanguinea]
MEARSPIAPPTHAHTTNSRPTTAASAAPTLGHLGALPPSTFTPSAPLSGGDFTPIFLPCSIGGFPTVHLGMPEALTRNIDPTQLRDWSAHSPATTTAVLVYRTDCSTDETMTSMVTTLRLAVVAITGCQNVVVSPAIAARGPDGDVIEPVPVTFFISHLSKTAATRLKKQICWSTREVAFFSYDLVTTIPPFLFGLEGFIQRDPQEIEEVVRGTLMQPEYWNFTLSLALHNPDFSGGIAHTIEGLMRSIEVRVMDVAAGPLIANVYSNLPTTSPALWHMWRGVLRDAEFRSSFIGVGQRARD